MLSRYLDALTSWSIIWRSRVVNPAALNGICTGLNRARRRSRSGTTSVSAARGDAGVRCAAKADALSIDFSTAASLKERIDTGGAFDVAILTDEVVDALIKSGSLAPATR